MKSILKIAVAGLAIMIISCSSMDKNDRKARRNDFFNKFSGKELTATSNWKFGDNILIMRKNKSFVFKEKVFGLITGCYYSGKYSVKGDTLRLTFNNNYKPKDCKKGYLLFDKIDTTRILRFENNYYVVITKNNFNK